MINRKSIVALTDALEQVKTGLEQAGYVIAKIQNDTLDWADSMVESDYALTTSPKNKTAQPREEDTPRDAEIIPLEEAKKVLTEYAAESKNQAAQVRQAIQAHGKKRLSALQPNQIVELFKQLGIDPGGAA